MASGIPVDDDCLQKFQELKTKRRWRYLIFGLADNNKSIKVLGDSDEADLSQPDPASQYKAFVAQQFGKPADGGDPVPGKLDGKCVWVVYDFQYDVEGGGIRQKLLFISWAPDNASIRQKMVFASSKEALRRSLVGIAGEVQATAPGELEYEDVLAKVKSNRF